MKLTIYSILLLIALTACNKDKAVEIVTGTIVNAQTGQPIQGAVIIEKVGYYSDPNNGSSSQKVIYTTGADGKYEVTVNSDDSPYDYRTYFVEFQDYIREPLCFDYENQQYYSTCNIQLIKPSILSASIENVSPFDTDDSFKGWVNVTNETGALVYRWEIDEGTPAFFHMNGYTAMDTMIRVLLPNKNYTLYYETVKNNVQTDSSINFSTTWGDSVHLNIEF